MNRPRHAPLERDAPLQRGTLRAGILLLVVVATATVAEAARLPRWANTIVSNADLERHQGADAVVLHERHELKLSGGERRGTWQSVVHILTDDGIDAGFVRLFSSQLEEYSRIRVWVRSPEGASRSIPTTTEPCCR